MSDKQFSVGNAIASARIGANLYTLDLPNLKLYVERAESENVIVRFSRFLIPIVENFRREFPEFENELQEFMRQKN